MKLRKIIIFIAAIGLARLSELQGMKKKQPLQKVKLGKWVEVTDVQLKRLPEDLKKLDLSGCDITSNDFQYLPKKLTKLIIGGKNITDSCLKDLPKSLQTLTITCCYITNDGLKYLPKGLTKLVLIGCKNVLLVDLPSIVPKLPNLKCLGAARSAYGSMKDFLPRE